MEKENRVIDFKYLPSHPARMVWLSAIIYLYMDRYNAPGWVHGIVWTVVSILFIGLAAKFFSEDRIEPLFKEVKDGKPR